ncbi:amino acid transporter [Microbacterium ulmi]|uniref:Amino acid transporter n=1 Tax=Microbacterium ulmi TaxID=179095 RepID=A0A7Y2M062_9MICO|nr:amino acid transporter [Microbacterium ulmi]NII69315.1 hypothetical protein [Microbacterium ulmi]NNH04071.1 amino acid transporter [Microbacterium ulmi]
MTDEKPTRRDLMKPVQLLGLAFGAALFAGIVTAVSMGVFQNRFEGQAGRALTVAAVVAGITFIVVLVGLALMILAVDPAQITKTVDHPVLRPEGEDEAKPDAAADGDGGAPTP